MNNSFTRELDNDFRLAQLGLNHIGFNCASLSQGKIMIRNTHMKASRYFFNGLIVFFFALVLVSVVSKIYGSLFGKPEIPSTASAPPPVKKLKLHCSFAQGSFVNHDVILSNTTGEDLSETKIFIKVIGENAAPSISRYWAKWPLGEKQTISVPVSDVKNIQRIQVHGSTDQGDIDQQWTIQ